MKSILVANWKMNPASFREAKTLFEATKKASDKAKNVQVVIAPPTIFLRQLRAGYRGKISFCIQNGFPEPGGAHTGETSFEQAQEAGASFALIGHAERRAMGESNELTKAKVASALKKGLTPIVCVGEIKRDVSGDHFPYIREQLRIGLSEVPPTSLKKVLIAYEPVWAIGAKTAMSPRDMHEMAIFIRKTVVEFFGDAGMDIRMLYGGAVDENSAVAMLRDGDVRGLLVGRASTETRSITNLLSAIAAA